jgi:hypothetical protein
VLTSRELFVQAETNYAQAKYGYLDNIVSLRLAAGSLDRRTVEMINSWLNEDKPAQPSAPQNPFMPPGALTAPPP